MSLSARTARRLVLELMPELHIYGKIVSIVPIDPTPRSGLRVTIECRASGDQYPVMAGHDGDHDAGRAREALRVQLTAARDARRTT